jgi:hypothetical protein
MTVSLQYVVERVARSLAAGAGSRLASRLPAVMFPVTLHDVMTLYAVKPGGAAVGGQP